MNYEHFFKRLAREILKREGRIDADTSAFVDNFVAQLRANGWQINDAIRSELNDYLQSMQQSIKDSIGDAAKLASSTMQSETVLAITDRAFKERWPDGLTLSDRVWKWQNETKSAVEVVLRQGIRQGRAVDRVMMDMQRAIEPTTGDERFKIVERHVDDWVTDLHESAQRLITDPKARQQWNDTVEEVKEHIESLKTTGTKRAAERLFDQAQNAVKKGREDLLDRAANWWIYDRQQYKLKRIARTEMATAGHRAVIESTKQDDDIIGYQWRLSSTHPVTDICDYYADIEFGLGRGVWPKDQVPDSKAHPHCMCLLIPRVSKINRKGAGNYADFLSRLPEKKRVELLPIWAQDLVKTGVDYKDLIRPDGLAIITKDEAKKKGFTIPN